MKRGVVFIAILFFAGMLCSFTGGSKKKASRDIIELRVYHFSTPKQAASVDSFLKLLLLPALHEAGITKVGVFTAIANDTAADKKMIVLIPHKSLKQFEEMPDKLKKNKSFSEATGGYTEAYYKEPPYNRFETILLQAFEQSPQVNVPQLTGKKSDRVYELRSYEGATEKIHANKVEMFNKGGEVGLFQRLNFNAVFYGEVLVGSHMPNLMYMTSFENKAVRDEHWKAFSADPFWKALSSKPEYQNNVSKIDIQFLTPTDYSDL